MSKTIIRERLLHEYQLGRTAAQARRNVCEALGVDAIKRSTAQNWFNKFKQGNYCVRDKSRSGRPKQLNDKAILQAIMENSTLTTRMIAMDNQCSHTAIEKILHRAGFNVRQGRWVPYDLTISQKKKRFDMAKQLLERQHKQPFLDRILTCDEKWISLDNRIRSKQWLKPLQAPKLTPMPHRHQKKVMLCVWWCTQGVVHWELVENGQAVTADLYCSQLQRVQSSLLKSNFRMLLRKGPVFQQDNARPHVARRSLEIIEQLGWERLIHPPYSPDVAPSDYHLFRSLQHSLAGKRFSEVDDVKKHLTTYFAGKSTEFYKQGIEKLPERWKKIVEHNGNYFE